MYPALDKVKEFIERNQMLRGRRGVVVAVSGGADSVALLDILKQISSTGEDGLRLHIAHLNHKLRGSESVDDADFVRRLAERFALPFTISEADVRLAAKTAGRGIEETAREIRYNFLLRVARESDCDSIATGHTMSDQAETFLMRVVRGAGLRGLAAMRPIAPVPVFDNAAVPEELTDRGGEGAKGRRGDGENISPSPRRPVAPSLPRPISPSPRRPVSPSSPLPSPLLIRPLLCLTREEVEQYCGERALEYRTDTTNLEANYTRNRVRLEVLPALREINPRVVESIARAAEIAAADQDALDLLACRMLDALREAPDKNAPGGLTQDSGSKRSVYSVAAFVEQPAGLRRRMILEAIDRHRLALRTNDPSAQIDSSHIVAVEALLAPESSGKRITLPEGLEAWREFDKLVFISTADIEPEHPAYQLEISAGNSLVHAGGLQITLEWKGGEGLEGALNQAKRLKRLIGSDWMMAALDRLLLPDHLIVRPRRKGERAHVVGQAKTKKLKKLMIDHRIPPSLRALWPIVATADDRYVWSPGLPPALEFAASDETHGLAILRASGA